MISTEPKYWRGHRVFVESWCTDEHRRRGNTGQTEKRVLKRKAYDSDDDELDEEEEDESDEFKSHEVTPAMVKSHDIPSRSVSFEKIPNLLKQTGTENSVSLYSDKTVCPGRRTSQPRI